MSMEEESDILVVRLDRLSVVSTSFLLMDGVGGFTGPTSPSLPPPGSLEAHTLRLVTEAVTARANAMTHVSGFCFIIGTAYTQHRN